MSANRALIEELAELRGRIYELEKRFDGLSAAENLPAGSFDVLVCRVRAERVAFLLGSVTEVVPIAETVALPEAPPWIVGLLNVRGDVMAVLDVAARTERSARTCEMGDLVLVCRVEDRSVGLVVQEVFDVHPVDRGDIEPPDPQLAHGPYLLGTLRQTAGVTLLFSVNRLIASSDLPAVEPPGAVTAAAPPDAAPAGEIG